MKIFKNLPNFYKKLITYTFYFVFVIVICVASCVVYNRFYYSFYYVDGQSMSPTLENLQFGMVDTHRDIFKYLQRYDIVVTYYPTDYYSNGSLKDNASLKIKRVIGLPNETITIKEDSLNNNVIELTDTNNNTTMLNLPFVPNDKDGLSNYVNNSYTLKDNQYFVMGDNWGHSSDSCSVGPIDLYMIEGVLIAIEGVCEVNDEGEVIKLTYTETQYFK